MKNRKYRRGAALAVSVALIMGLGTVSAGASRSVKTSGKPYTVTVQVDLTGVTASTVGPAAAGVQVYFDMLNKKNGVNGHEVKYTIVDGQATVDGGAAAVQKALADPPMGYMAFVSGAEGARIIPMLTTAKIPLVTISAADNFMYPPQAGVYMVQPTTLQQAHAQAVFMQEKLGGSLTGKRFAIAQSATPFTDLWASELTAEIRQMGGDVVDTERFDIGLPSFTAQASKIAAAKVDAVFFGSTGADAVVVSNALKAAGVNVPINAYASASGEAVIKAVANPNYQGLTDSTYVSANPELAKAAADAGKTKEANASTYFGTGFAGAAVMAEGLRKCGNSCTAAKLSKALESIKDFTIPMKATYGPITFTKQNHGGVTKVQFHAWDATKQAVVDVGTPVDTIAGKTKKK